MSHTPTPRFHHLDALRAFAMLLGVVLHALLSFVEIPIWPAQDVTRGHPAYSFAQHAIHGFRMPLFFLISGFFTAMLWKRRGLKKLIRHRFLRIFLPLVVGWFAFVPLLFGIGFLGESAKQAARENPEAASVGIFGAVQAGDTDAVAAFLDDGTGVDHRNNDGLTLLHWACLTGNHEVATLLLDRGADPNVRDRDNYTPLHGAAFLGRDEIVILLVERGAELNPRGGDGSTPLDSAFSDWGIVEYIAGLIGVKVERVEVETGQAKVRRYLQDQGGRSGKDGEGEAGAGDGALGALLGIYQFLAMIPVFHHLWFLYYLIWLVAGFSLVAWLVSRRERKPLPNWMMASPTCFLWLVPLTILPQFFMRQGFGPDTAIGLLPWLPKFLYYAIFFGFGALCFGRGVLEQRAGRFWYVYFALSLPILLLGLHSLHSGLSWWLTSACAALYAWLTIYGCAGLFRQFFSRPNRTIRFVSDSSYWIYLAHLPLVMVLQIAIMTWPLPSLVKMIGICLVTYAILLVMYRYLVRYTPIGTLLNGRKVHPSKAPPPIPEAPH